MCDLSIVSFCWFSCSKLYKRLFRFSFARRIDAPFKIKKLAETIYYIGIYSLYHYIAVILVQILRPRYLNLYFMEYLRSGKTLLFFLSGSSS